MAHEKIQSMVAKMTWRQELSPAFICAMQTLGSNHFWMFTNVYEIRILHLDSPFKASHCLWCFKDIHGDIHIIFPWYVETAALEPAPTCVSSRVGSDSGICFLLPLSIIFLLRCSLHITDGVKVFVFTSAGPIFKSHPVTLTFTALALHLPFYSVKSGSIFPYNCFAQPHILHIDLSYAAVWITNSSHYISNTQLHPQGRLKCRSYFCINTLTNGKMLMYVWSMFSAHVLEKKDSAETWNCG